MPFEPVPSERLQELLSPYRPESTHVLSARVGGAPDGAVTVEAELRFDAPAHRLEATAIDGIETNIAYNQMLYVGLGEAVVRHLDPVFADWDWELYRARQLPNVLILDFAFECGSPAPHRGAIRGSFRFASFERKRTMILTRTHARFEDGDGRAATCDVTVALVDEAPRIAGAVTQP